MRAMAAVTAVVGKDEGDSNGNKGGRTKRVRAACHRPRHYGGKHSLLNVAIC